MTDFGKVQKTAYFGHFLAFLDAKKQAAIFGPHFKSLNLYSYRLMVQKI